MCGIAGIVSLDNKKVDGLVVQQMTSLLTHRGPDGEGLYIRPKVGLGHRRLKVLDLTVAGHQPMSDPEGRFTVVYNGEIYNYLELKRQLGSRTYLSRTDTEVILHAFDQWGESCVDHFNGIFAFALWDEKKQQLFAARDRLGVKPFYYTVHENSFYFASEIKSLLAAGIPAKPNQKVINDYLLRGYYDHSAETFFENIFQLPPGHLLSVKDGQLKFRRYWYLPDRIQEDLPKSDEECTRRFLDLLEDAVKIQLRSDVPIGISVSGGLDSSLLTSLVNKIQQGQEKLRLFHFTFNHGTYDTEMPYVKLLAEDLGWHSPTVVTVNPEDFPEMLPKILWHQEQPFPGAPTFGWHKLYKQIGSTDCVVTLEGHGGDEIGAGYDYYAGSFLLDLLQGPGSHTALQEYNDYLRVHGLEKEQALQFLFNNLESYLKGAIAADGSRCIIPECLSPDFVQASSHLPEFEKPFDSFLKNMQYRDLVYTKLPRVLRSVDRDSMAYGREVRVPLLDHRLVEFAFSLPLHQKIGSGHQRLFMRRAASQLLPKALSTTPKRSSPDPQREWFKKELRPWILEIIRSKSFGERGYFDQKRVWDAYEQYGQQKAPQNSFPIWQWICLEYWHRIFIDKKEPNQ